jgi:AraC-like DNA-binding protein
MAPLHIEELARRVNMAESTFHRHFREVTTMSPLQFQKRLRLYEAQRRMLVDDRDANTVALEVGYESATQFNREYKRMFGEPPYRDVSRLRASGAGAPEMQML